MAAFIKTLQDASRENIIYPRTKSEAVHRDDNATSVEDTLVNLESEVASIIENTNNISGVYETKEDASAKLAETKAYIDEQIVNSVVDWNQNDETAPDYVKNRTHYVGAPTKATIIEEQTVTITSDGGAAQLTSSPLYFTGNETYIVNFDGIEYECIANDRGLRCSIGYDDNTNWGEDGKPESPIFSCSSYLEDNSVYLTVKTAGTYTVSIASVTHNIVQIPAMYLPNSNVMNGDGDGAVQTGQATAIGYDSHAEGWSTANGDRSHAEGFSTANGSMSHAEGSSTANGISSHAEGKSTANGWCQHTQGKYNIEDETSAHIVGNGESTPSNAHTLDWNGNAWFAGDVYVGSTSGTNKDDGSKKLITIDEMNAAIKAAIGAAIGGSY